MKNISRKIAAATLAATLIAGVASPAYASETTGSSKAAWDFSIGSILGFGDQIFVDAGSSDDDNSKVPSDAFYVSPTDSGVLNSLYRTFAVIALVSAGIYAAGHGGQLPR